MHSPSGGRSWKRWQEHISLHTSMKRKLSSSLSDSSLSMLSDPGTRKAAATGDPPCCHGRCHMTMTSCAMFIICMRAVLEKHQAAHQHEGKLSSSLSDCSLSLLSDPGTCKAAAGGKAHACTCLEDLHSSWQLGAVSLEIGVPNSEPQVQSVSGTIRSWWCSGPFPKTSAEDWDNESFSLAAGSHLLVLQAPPRQGCAE